MASDAAPHRVYEWLFAKMHHVPVCRNVVKMGLCCVSLWLLVRDVLCWWMCVVLFLQRAQGSLFVGFFARSLHHLVHRILCIAFFLAHSNGEDTNQHLWLCCDSDGREIRLLGSLEISGRQCPVCYLLASLFCAE